MSKNARLTQFPFVPVDLTLVIYVLPLSLRYPIIRVLPYRMTPISYAHARTAGLPKHRCALRPEHLDHAILRNSPHLRDIEVVI